MFPERVDMIEVYFKIFNVEPEPANLFNQMHADKHVSGEIMRELVAKFRETDSVQNEKRHVENPVLDERVK